MPAAAASAGPAKTVGWPARESSPRSAPTAPTRILESVLLPQPLEPTSAWTSPARSSNSAPSRATTPPNRLAIPDARSRGAAGDSPALGSGSGRGLLEEGGGFVRRHDGGDREVARLVLHLLVDLLHVGVVDERDRN